MARNQPASGRVHFSHSVRKQAKAAGKALLAVAIEGEFKPDGVKAKVVRIATVDPVTLGPLFRAVTHNRIDEALDGMQSVASCNASTCRCGRCKRCCDEILAVLEELVDIHDCVIDEHGACTKHGYPPTGHECPHHRAKALLQLHGGSGE